MKTPRQSVPPNSSTFSLEEAAICCEAHLPPGSRSKIVKELRPMPPLAVTTTRADGPTASPKGPAPLPCCSPSRAMTRPPGRIDAVACLWAWQIPAGAVKDCAASTEWSVNRESKKRQTAGTNPSYIDPMGNLCLLLFLNRTSTRGRAELTRRARPFPKPPIPHRSYDLSELLHCCTKREYYLARQVLNNKLKISLSRDVVLSPAGARETPITGCVASLAADGFSREVFAQQLG